jgi:hypothetical protein
MIILGLGLLLVVFGASPFMNITRGIGVFVLVSLAMIACGIDILAPKEQRSLYSSDITTLVPLDYKNPDNILLVVERIDRNYLYLAKPVEVRRYSLQSKHKIILLRETLIEVHDVPENNEER